MFTFWNVLGELGGLYGVFFGLFDFLVSKMTYQRADNILASHIYDKPRSSSKYKDQSERILDASKEPSYKAYFWDVILRSCCK